MLLDLQLNDLDKEADQMARDCHEHILSSLRTMSSLVGTAVSGLSAMTAEMKKFQYRGSFSESWEKNLEGMSSMQLLEQFLGIKNDEPQNLKIEFMVESIKAENDDVKLKKRLIDALNCCSQHLKRMLDELSDHQHATVHEIWKNTLGFQSTFKNYTTQYKRCLLVASRGNPDSSISRLLPSILTQKGLNVANDFQDICEELHRNIRDMFNRVEEDASQQYNQTIRDVLSKIDIWKRVELSFHECEDSLKSVTQVDPQESVKIHISKKKVLQLLEEVKIILQNLGLLLIKESPKVIRGSFELVEHVLDEMFTALKKTKDRCEKAGLMELDQLGNPNRDMPEIHLRFPKETIDLLKQITKNKMEPRRKFNPPNSMESGQFKHQVFDLTKHWFQYMSDYIPFHPGSLNRELSRFSDGVLSMLPCGGNSPTLLLKVKEHKVRISDGIKVSGTFYTIPDAIIFDGRRFGNDQQFTLLFPRVSIKELESVGDDTGKECLLNLKTIKGKLPVYLLGADREALHTWFRLTSKDQEEKFPILRIKHTEHSPNPKAEDHLCWTDSVWLPVPSNSSVAGSVKIPERLTSRLRSRAHRAFRSAFWLAEMGGRVLESKALFAGMQLSTFLPFLIGNSKLKTHLGALFEASFMKYRKDKDQLEIIPLSPNTSFIHDSEKPIQALVEHFLLLPAATSTARLYHSQGTRVTKVQGIVVTVMDCMLDTVLICVNSETGAESQLWVVRQLQHGVEVLRSNTLVPNRANQEGDFDTCWKNLIHKKLEEIANEQLTGRKGGAIYDGPREPYSHLNVSRSVTKGSGNSTTMMQDDELNSMHPYPLDFPDQEDGWTEDLSAPSSEGGEEEQSILLDQLAKK